MSFFVRVSLFFTENLNISIQAQRSFAHESLWLECSVEMVISRQRRTFEVCREMQPAENFFHISCIHLSLFIFMPHFFGPWIKASIKIFLRLCFMSSKFPNALHSPFRHESRFIAFFAAHSSFYSITRIALGLFPLHFIQCFRSLSLLLG